MQGLRNAMSDAPTGVKGLHAIGSDLRPAIVELLCTVLKHQQTDNSDFKCRTSVRDAEEHNGPQITLHHMC